MAITYVGQYRVPTTENSNTTYTSLTFDKDDAGVSSITTGDVVIAFLTYRAAASGFSVTTTGGQTWTEVHDASDQMGNALYTCVFNGTWDADPVWDLPGTAADGATLWVVVLRGVDTADIWDVDPVWATDSDASFDIATFNTNTTGAWAILFAGATDNNTWSVDNSFVAPSGSGNIYWRCSGGSDSAAVICCKEIASAGGVGATTMTQAAADAGFKVYGAIKKGATTFERAASFDVTTAAITAAVQRARLRAATFDVTAASITAAATFYTTFERVATLDVTQASITAAATFYTTLERAASLDVTQADITAAATHTHHFERASAFDATADILADGEIASGATERAATLDATADLVIAAERHSRFQVRGLVATAVSTSEIDLYWDDVAALTGEAFDIERNGSVVEEDYTGTHTVGDPYVDDGLDPETEYTYRVRAVGGAVV